MVFDFDVSDEVPRPLEPLQHPAGSRKFRYLRPPLGTIELGLDDLGSAFLGLRDPDQLEHQHRGVQELVEAARFLDPFDVHVEAVFTGGGFSEALDVRKRKISLGKQSFGVDEKVI